MECPSDDESYSGRTCPLFFAEGVQAELPISMLHGWTEYYAESYRCEMAPMSSHI